MKYYVAVIGIILIVVILLLNTYTPTEDNIFHPALIDDIKAISFGSPIVSEFVKNNPKYNVSVEPIEDDTAEDIIGIGPWEGSEKVYYKLIFRENDYGSSIVVIVDWTDRKVSYTKENRPERICIPGSVKCQNDRLQNCSEDGKSWIDIENCAYGCIDGHCIIDSNST
ncbi:MAG: hypothetical protein JW716_02640 [Candidatus Aenigmarchaeota archaeon]|nr:hypothetical protein [Candidatus Aenigmarchaeota archaeon]